MFKSARTALMAMVAVAGSFEALEAPAQEKVYRSHGSLLVPGGGDLPENAQVVDIDLGGVTGPKLDTLIDRKTPELKRNDQGKINLPDDYIFTATRPVAEAKSADPAEVTSARSPRPLVVNRTTTHNVSQPRARADFVQSRANQCRVTARPALHYSNYNRYPVYPRQLNYPRRAFLPNRPNLYGFQNPGFGRRTTGLIDPRGSWILTRDGYGERFTSYGVNGFMQQQRNPYGATAWAIGRQGFSAHVRRGAFSINFSPRGRVFFGVGGIPPFNLRR